MSFTVSSAVIRGVKANSLQIPIFQRYGCGYDGAGPVQSETLVLNPIPLPELRFDAAAQLSSYQSLLSLARETVPQATAAEAKKALAGSAARLGLELVENGNVVPIFLLLPPAGVTPRVTIFAGWHGEGASVGPAAVGGAERLALAAGLLAIEAVAETGALGPPGTPPQVAVVIAPGASQGSVVLGEALRTHRARLEAPVAFWPRIAPGAPRRRRVFLGARGRVVVGIWGDGANAWSIRDALVKDLTDEAYGPRPLDFELLRKLAQSAEALDFLEETIGDPAAVAGSGEERLRRALFDPLGQVSRPAAPHPDRPHAWLTIETAEAMEPEDILGRVRALAGTARAELAEGFIWDRAGIHHPGTQALIGMAKSRSDGPEIWPMAPWVTPSGLFTRALGTGLAEWAVPLPPATMVRFPKPEALETIAREIAELLLRGSGAISAIA